MVEEEKVRVFGNSLKGGGYIKEEEADFVEKLNELNLKKLTKNSKVKSGCCCGKREKLLL